jgi:hypothetical protein
METLEIIRQIDRLPIIQKMLIVEEIIHSIREKEQSEIIRNAADILYADYKYDNTLTEFTSLDYEDFYEAR